MSKKKLYIIKIGGNIIDDELNLVSFLKLFACLQGHHILVHGGGKEASRISTAMGLEPQMVDGRRVTDEKTLAVVTMVYAGLINKNIVAHLQANGCNAIGLCGADANIIVAHKRVVSGVDYGYAGDIDFINHSALEQLLQDGLTPVLAPITHNGKGQLLNTNADTIAGEVAKAMASLYDVDLVYGFEKQGVLRDVENPESIIEKIDSGTFDTMKEKSQVHAGMLPKLDNAFDASRHGVSRVMIGHALQLNEILAGTAGTIISHE